jgi:flagellar motor switch protein FliN/FliY
MMMSLDQAQSDLLKNSLQTLLNHAGESLGNMLGLTLTLGAMEGCWGETLLDLPDAFEGESPLLGSVSFRSGLAQPFFFLMKEGQAKVLANFMLGGSGSVEEQEPLSDIQRSAVGEALNQMMSGAMNQVLSTLTQRVDVALADVQAYEGEALGNLAETIEAQDGGNTGYYASYGQWTLSDGNTKDPLEFALLLSQTTVEAWLALQQGGAPAAAPTPTTVVALPMPEAPTRAEAVAETVDAQGVSVRREDALGGMAGAGLNFNAGAHSSNLNPNGVVQPLQFAPLPHAPVLPQSDIKNLELMLDIKLNLHVELGRTRLSIKEVLEMTRGSVIELDRVAGESVDLFANGKLIAKGEVVVIEDNFGLRVTSIISPQERMLAH